MSKSSGNIHEEKKELDIILSIIFSAASFSLIFSCLAYFFLSGSERIAAVVTILGIGITITAFLPQLVMNHMKKAEATDPVLAIFLIMAAVGVLLRLPALRHNLSNARATNRGILLITLICIATIIPLIAHNIWQWQAAVYDDAKALIAKEILVISAPITTIVSVGAILWLFSAPSIKLK